MGEVFYKFFMFSLTVFSVVLLVTSVAFVIKAFGRPENVPECVPAKSLVNISDYKNYSCVLKQVNVSCNGSSKTYYEVG